MCGDGQTSAKDLIKVIRKFEKEKLDFCQVRRVKREGGVYRKFLSKGFNFLAHLMFNIPTSDIGGNPKIMKKEIYEKLNITSKDWFIETEILYKLSQYDVKIGEVPTVFKKRKKGSSHIKFNVIIEFLRNMIKYKMKNRFINFI